jgi:peptide/nickel transport system permease protein
MLNIDVHRVTRELVGDSATPEQIAMKEQELGLDKPLSERFFEWLTSAIRGDFGTSWFTNEKVFDAIGSRLNVTLTLVFISIAFALVISVSLGILAALKGGWLDRFIQLLAIFSNSVPTFIVAIITVTIFAINLGLLPATGWVAFSENPSGWALSLVLPVFAIVSHAVASAAQQIRSAFKQVLERDFVRTLRSRGIKPREIIFRHVLRAAAPAGLTVLSLQLIGMLGGTIVIENIFALPGMGQLALQSTIRSDVPVVMGVVIYTVVVVLIVNIFVDLINGWLNPKVRS